jgi:dihydrolipoamide dehydrogenase
MKQHDLIVIGAGPAGYTGAIRAAQLDMDVACIEKESALGGTCLRVGCIPSKALLESSELFVEATNGFKRHGFDVGEVKLDLQKMLKQKQRTVDALTKGVGSLFVKNKITRYTGQAKLNGPGQILLDTAGGEQKLTAKHILIATGSKPAPLPGIEWVADRIGNSADALSYADVPERLVVIGAGYIGLEIGTIWRRLGSQVTVLEYLDRILPGMDTELADEACKIFKKQGLKFRFNSRVTGARVEGERCVVECEAADPIECDRLLVAVGRVPNTAGLNLQSVGVTTDEGGRIPVDERYQTSASGLYAVGDVIRGPQLAHKAADEAVACVESICDVNGKVNYDAIPAVVYTNPEIASVGRSEDALKQSGVEFRKGTFPFLANGRARALAQTEGFIKVLADAETDRVLGVQIIGPRAGELIAEAVVAIEFGATSEDLAGCSHAHPTLSEVYKDASLDVADRAVNI